MARGSLRRGQTAPAGAEARPWDCWPGKARAQSPAPGRQVRSAPQWQAGFAGTANAGAPVAFNLAAECCWRCRQQVWALARAPAQPGAGAGRRFAAHGLVVEANFGDTALLQVTAARLMHDFEGVKADPAHERDLIREHVADGAQLAAKAILLAQQAGHGKRAAVGELRKIEGDQRE